MAREYYAEAARLGRKARSIAPVATCIGVIVLLWLTTVANFGGPSWTGRIGSVTVWGVIIPVGLLSVIGWFWFKPATFAAGQFTIAQTGKSAADERMFPAFFSKVNRLGAPITGMVVLGIVQSALALSTISPSLSEQFQVLVNLAVVTNVVPYIIALSALMVMMKTAGVPEATYRRNVAVALVAMLYSVYAIYASGKDAVLGGMLVTGISFVIWGFIAPRFTANRLVTSELAKAA